MAATVVRNRRVKRVVAHKVVDDEGEAELVGIHFALTGEISDIIARRDIRIVFELGTGNRTVFQLIFLKFEPRTAQVALIKGHTVRGIEIQKGHARRIADAETNRHIHLPATLGDLEGERMTVGHGKRGVSAEYGLGRGKGAADKQQGQKDARAQQEGVNSDCNELL